MASINSKTGGFLLIIFYSFHCFTVEWANPQLPSWPTTILKFSEKQVFDILAFTWNSHKHGGFFAAQKNIFHIKPEKRTTEHAPENK